MKFCLTFSLNIWGLCLLLLFLQKYKIIVFIVPLDKLKAMKYNKNVHYTIVAGGAGFIGYHLCKRLLKEGRNIVCVDNLSTGNLNNVSKYIGKDNFIFLNHDVVNALSIDCNVDEIYNLACPASPVQYQKDPVHTFLTSVVGTKNLLELAKEKNARILHFSTSEVCGNPSMSPQREDYWGNVNMYGPRSCYDEGKRGAETLFHDYQEQYGIDTRIVRVFNTYGPKMAINDGRVVSNFIVQALQGKPLTIYGNGKQTRSLQYIDDLIEGVLRMMADDVPHTPINLGNPHEMNIGEIADLILRLTGSSSPIVYYPLPQDDPQQRCPDISKATKLLDGWQPRIGIEEGLLKTIEYFKKEILLN